tara:strand:- start:409 stop:1044 length:636 start_codon:yes stop_codon:yes gene_type:complete
MIVIGITGSIGMGKTTISAMFRLLNIPVFDSDKEVKEILEINKEVKEKIADIWPETIVSFKNEKKINKVLLSSKIFKTKHERKTLEKIIHPLVRIKRKSFFEKNKECYFVGLDIPLLYETGADKECHYIFLANTSIEKQRKRVLQRQNMTEEKFNLINNSQWSFERKKKKKPFLISTSFGKLTSFFIVLVYLFKITISDKVFNNERTSPRH